MRPRGAAIRPAAMMTPTWAIAMASVATAMTPRKDVAPHHYALSFRACWYAFAAALDRGVQRFQQTLVQRIAPPCRRFGGFGFRFSGPVVQYSGSRVRWPAALQQRDRGTAHRAEK